MLFKFLSIKLSFALFTIMYLIEGCLFKKTAFLILFNFKKRYLQFLKTWYNNNAIEIAKMATMVKRPNTPDCGSGIRAFESR